MSKRSRFFGLLMSVFILVFFFVAIFLLLCFVAMSCNVVAEESKTLKLVQKIETVPGIFVARNQQEFDKIEFLRDQVTGLDYPWPVINFDKYMVVFVFGSPQRATQDNYTVRIMSVGAKAISEEDTRKKVTISAQSTLIVNDRFREDSVSLYAPCAIHVMNRKSYGIDNTATFSLQMREILDLESISEKDVARMPHAATIRELFRK